MMRRRFLLLGLVLIAAPLVIQAQPAGKVYRIGFPVEGKTERLAQYAAELARLKVDVIVTAAAPGARAANRRVS